MCMHKYTPTYIYINTCSNHPVPVSASLCIHVCVLYIYRYVHAYIYTICLYIDMCQHIRAPKNVYIDPY